MIGWICCSNLDARQYGCVFVPATWDRLTIEVCKMSYKTILVHLNTECQAGPLLEFGVALARYFESRLIGLHVFPSFRLTPPVPSPSLCWEKTTGRQGRLGASSRSRRPAFRVLSISWSNPMPIRSVDIPYGKGVGDVILYMADAPSLPYASDHQWSLIS